MTEEQQVLAAVDGYWRTWEEANNPPDPNHPGLAQYFTGPALEKALQEIRKKQTENLFAERPPNSRYAHRRRVIEVMANEAAVEDCIIDDFVVKHVSGAVVDDAVVTHQLVLHLVNDGSGWQVAEVERVGRWEGVQGCAIG
jgi:hypothetical protein